MRQRCETKTEEDRDRQTDRQRQTWVRQRWGNKEVDRQADRHNVGETEMGNKDRQTETDRGETEVEVGRGQRQRGTYTE